MTTLISLNAQQIMGKTSDAKELYLHAVRHFFDINYDGEVDEPEAEAGIQAVESLFYFKYEKDRLHKLDKILQGREIANILELAREYNQPDKSNNRYWDGFPNYNAGQDDMDVGYNLAVVDIKINAVASNGGFGYITIPQYMDLYDNNPPLYTKPSFLFALEPADYYASALKRFNAVDQSQFPDKIKFPYMD